MSKHKGQKIDPRLNLAREPSYDSYPNVGCRYFPFDCEQCPYAECVDKEQSEFKGWWSPQVAMVLFMRGKTPEEISVVLNWHLTKVEDQLERAFGKDKLPELKKIFGGEK